MSFNIKIIILDDHARGLSTFTIMAGLGGFFGYALGGIDWDNTSIGNNCLISLAVYILSNKLQECY